MSQSAASTGSDSRCGVCVYGKVASDPTISGTITALAGDAGAALASINLAGAAARAAVWALAGEHAPDHQATAANPLIIDLDATLVTSHSQKEHATPTFKRGYGFHPLWAFADHGPAGTGEPLAVALRAGNAGPNTAADHIRVTRDALAQLPSHRPGIRAGRKVAIRVDGAGSTHKYLAWLAGQRLSYSVGFCLPDTTPELLAKIPAARVGAGAGRPRGGPRRRLGRRPDQPAEPDQLPRPGCGSSPARERPHPDAQLRITDIDGLRVTTFATNTRTGGPGTQLADLELRHRRRARCQDRIRLAKDTGLTNLPLHSFDANRIWCAIIALAVEITAWMQLLTLTGDDATTHGARRWEPKRLPHRLLTIPAALARTSKQVLLHLSSRAPWAHLVHQAITRLRALAQPG